MTEKRFRPVSCVTDWYIEDKKTSSFVVLTPHQASNLLNELYEENEKLKKVIAENEKLIQSTYDELTKLRHIKKNLERIKTQWNWIMEAIQYD